MNPYWLLAWRAYAQVGLLGMIAEQAGGQIVVAFQCPRCGARSAHPTDVAEGYCGRCHAWTGRPL